MVSGAVIVLAAIVGCAASGPSAPADCETSVTVIQPKQYVGEDGERYVMINIPGFRQNATSAECLPNQSCGKGSCQQDYKLHQFLTVPDGKQLFELSDVKFRFFKIPYGCKCVPLN